MRKVIGWFIVIFIGVILLGVVLYNLPPVNQALARRVEELRARVLYALNPPEEVVFVPGQGSTEGDATATLPPPQVTTATPTATQTPEQSADTPEPSPTVTPTFTPLPEQVLLSGVGHEYQQMNNCGPATLAMALKYYGWSGNQATTRAVLRPNFEQVDDKNVSPWEMARYVEEQTPYKAQVRVGADQDLIRRLLAAGFPVIIEKGFIPPGDAWMGHYQLLSGYDDAGRFFTAQDSYDGPNQTVPYDLVAERWRDFNRVLVVTYPAEQEEQVRSLLGERADEEAAFQLAAQNVQAEIDELSGVAGAERDLYFAWFNLGSNLLALGDYAGAAAAYDQAFAVYAAIPDADRPWRNLWYQVGPYEAYYHMGRYNDVVELGNRVLSTTFGPVLEETFYWMGLARESAGDLPKAIDDYSTACFINPTSTSACQELTRLGVLP